MGGKRLTHGMVPLKRIQRSIPFRPLGHLSRTRAGNLMRSCERTRSLRDPGCPFTAARLRSQARTVLEFEGLNCMESKATTGDLLSGSQLTNRPLRFRLSGSR
jgi:hypothetical protein